MDEKRYEEETRRNEATNEGIYEQVHNNNKQHENEQTQSDWDQSNSQYELMTVCIHGSITVIFVDSAVVLVV